MTPHLRTIVLFLMLVFPAVASATTWDIDPDHSSIEFKVKHLMVSSVKGTFTKQAGVVEINDKDITKSKIGVTIATNSVSTNLQKRDEHLRSADFLDVARFPFITFISKKIVTSATGAMKVTGDLTIHGVTKEIILDVEQISKESKDPWGNMRRGTSASTKINRKDFGLVWNKSLETGGFIVGEEITVSLEIEMIKSVAK